MANQQDVLTPEAYAEMRRGAEERRIVADRDLISAYADRRMCSIMDQITDHGPDRVYIYSYGSPVKSTEVAVEIASRLERAGWRVTHGEVNFWNRFYHYWFKKPENGGLTQYWWFSLSPAVNDPRAAQ